MLDRKYGPCSPKRSFGEDEESEGPPAKRHARGSVSPLANSLGSAPSSPFSTGSSASAESRDDADKGFTRFQPDWRSSFRDQDDFEYTVKLLRRSMGEPTTRPLPPTPIELLRRVFPNHRREVLELVLKGCDGNLIQAIESILTSDCIYQRKAGAKPSSLPTMHLDGTFPGIPPDAVYPSMPLAGPSLLHVMRPMYFRNHNMTNMAPRPPLPDMTERSVPVTTLLTPFVPRAPEQNHVEAKPIALPLNKSPSLQQSCSRCGAESLSGNRFCGKCGAEMRSSYWRGRLPRFGGGDHVFRSWLSFDGGWMETDFQTPGCKDQGPLFWVHCKIELKSEQNFIWYEPIYLLNSY